MTDRSLRHAWIEINKVGVGVGGRKDGSKIYLCSLCMKAIKNDGSKM